MPAANSKIVPVDERFDLDPPNSAGLSLRVRGGTFLHPSDGYVKAPNATLILAASAVNFIEVSPAGVISSNTTGFTATAAQLYVVTTGTTLVTGILDCRGMVQDITVDAGSTVGGAMVIFRFDFAAGANAAQNIVMAAKTRIIDAFLILRGAGVSSEVLTVGNAGNGISSAMAASGSDQALVRSASMNDANWDIAAGGQLRATPSAGATQPDMTVFVIGVRVP